MSGFELKMDDEQIKQAVNGAIVAMLTDDAKQALIVQAVEHLTKDRVFGEGHRRETRPSPVMEAFNRELERITNEEMRHQLAENPDFAKVVEATVREVVSTAILDEKGFWHKLAMMSGKAMENWLEEEKGYR